MDPDSGTFTESFQPPRPGHSVLAPSFVSLWALLALSETVLLTDL